MHWIQDADIRSRDPKYADGQREEEEEREAAEAEEREAALQGLITNFNAEADGVTTDDIINTLLKETRVDTSDPATTKQMDAVMR